MAIQKTPGVYIEEIATLPASVAPVATAIPAFIGYTEIAGTPASPLTNVPTRITSLLEYMQNFGGPFNEVFPVTLSDTGATADFSKISKYVLYYHLQLYYANGGGPCYIVSVGTYGSNTDTIDDTKLSAGLDKVAAEDEVTLLVIPEAISLPDATRKTLYDKMLAQCEKLQDRFAIFDVAVTGTTPNPITDATNFRTNDIGTNSLKYGAAYYPSLITALSYVYNDNAIIITDSRTVKNPDFTNTPLGILTGQNQYASIKVTDNTKVGDDSYVINGTTVAGGVDFVAGASDKDSAVNIRNAINRLRTTSPALTNIQAILDPADTNLVTVQIIGSNQATNTLSAGSADGSTITAFAASDVGHINKDLYNTISIALKKTLVLYPSATMAGIYAQIDGTRGVWKAPANVSVAMVSEPAVKVKPDDQGLLNIDPTSGKSVNVIRKFEGKGTLVWGARTLAGNDNEWRYVPVRRLFIFVEESVKKATEFVVFEPNDANTWIKVKAMIENFLTSLWRDGALAGAKPEAAFFVKVGLGTTMTALDILEGRMNIEIGLAAVRPAEFIILKFSHKLQES